MSCRILFIRHGQSLGNLNNLFLGHTDIDLSLLGYKQAEVVSEFLLKEKVDIIYSSDLQRAYNTSLPLAKKLGIKPILNKNLREMFAGEWENKKFDSLIECFPQSFKIWRDDIGKSRPENGESAAELYERIVTEVKTITEKNGGKTIAVFTHATPIRAFFTYINEKNVMNMNNIPWPSNASVSEAVYINGEFKTVRYSYDEFLGAINSSFP